MACPGCLADPQPPFFGDPRKCAFDAQGNFTSDNWSCATMDALREMLPYDGESTYGDFATRDDNSAGSLGLLHIPDSAQDVLDDLHGIEQDELSLAGYLVMSWYKQRGQCGSATIIFEDEPVRPLKVDEAQAILTARQNIAKQVQSR
jgi:hypothetical protein